MQLRVYTNCPSRTGGGFNCHLRISDVVFEISAIHMVTSGLTVPGVGYLTFLVSGNELPEIIPLAAIIAPDANHGYVIIPTLVSLKDAYIKCEPSGDDQMASGSLNISSVEGNETGS